jgi:hypothetical protein
VKRLLTDEKVGQPAFFLSVCCRSILKIVVEKKREKHMNKRENKSNARLY